MRFIAALKRGPRLFVPLLSLLVAATFARAVPPNPRLWESSESARERYAQIPPDPIREHAGMQPDGLEYVLVLRVDFRDQPGVRPRAQLDRWLFDPNSASLASYYDEVSYGKMKVRPGPDGGSYPLKGGWYRMPKPMSFYGEGRITVALYQQLVRDAANAADPDVNFKDFDRDGDGILDHLIILHAGNDEASTGEPNDIWSITVPDIGAAWDGVRVEAAVVIAEEPAADVPHLGVWFHEFFHDFGAPETYVNGTLVGSHDNQFSLMGLFGPYQGGGGNRDGTRPSHISGYLKWDFDGVPENGRHGWITPVEIDTNTIGFRVPAFSMPKGQPPLYKIDVPGKGGREFFLIENRSRSVGARFDTAIPDEGLLIWHIDETVDRSAFSVARRMWLEDPADPEHQDLSLTITHDAAYAAEDDQTAFTPSTKPNSNANDGSPTGISLLNIGPSGPVMTADLFFGDTYEPNDTLARAYPIEIDRSYRAFIWDASDAVDLYRLDVAGGDRLRIDVSFAERPDARVALLDAAARVLTSGHRAPSEEGGFAVELLYRSPMSQRLYIEIRPNRPVAASVPYALTASIETAVAQTPPRFRSLFIFPNPVRSGEVAHFAVGLASAGVDRLEAEVFTAAGERVGSASASAILTGDATFDFPTRNAGRRLAPGVYFVLFTAVQGDQITKRLAKFAIQ